ncbi:hypothetical protein CgunFtcFv8_016155 [Champsocephalus gunnari]|uniref:Uncharacterized protein n=1 Tax=Champsocephalus gunnari TaxID=52237 RepID=A0AAN8CR04_CHAGU|nr:hypothetical protein CgunFtcFv8_016155 [Champsocephalus gunnari]
MPFTPPPLPSPPSLLATPTHDPGNRAVTLLLTRSESINTLALHALSHGTRAMGDSSVALQPPALAHEDRWWSCVAGAHMRWQPYPKPLGRPWNRASQLSQGQK